LISIVALRAAAGAGTTFPDAADAAGAAPEAAGALTVVAGRAGADVRAAGLVGAGSAPGTKISVIVGVGWPATGASAARRMYETVASEPATRTAAIAP
jgi:hypothetical protein